MPPAAHPCLCCHLQHHCGHPQASPTYCHCLTYLPLNWHHQTPSTRFSFLTHHHTSQCFHHSSFYLFCRIMAGYSTIQECLVFTSSSSRSLMARSIHEGIQKMLHHLRVDFYVSHDRQLVRNFIRACVICQRNKTNSASGRPTTSPSGSLQYLG